VCQTDWPDGLRLAVCRNYKFVQAVATPLKQSIPSAGTEGLALMTDMLKWDPQRRPTAQQVQHRVGHCSCVDDDDAYIKLLCFLPPYLQLATFEM